MTEPIVVAVDALTDAISRLDPLARAKPDWTLAGTSALLAIIEDRRRLLGDLADWLSDRTGERMGSYRQPVLGVGTLERHSRKKRTEWQTEDLIRSVLDSRLVDTKTGELIDETPLDKVRHVWNLGAPRTGALKERGIDPDDFCNTEGSRDGYSIRIHRDAQAPEPTLEAPE